MTTKNSISVVLLSTLLFGLLFHNQALGINLVIYEALMLGWLFSTKQLSLKSSLEKLMVTSQVVTLTFTVVHHSNWSYLIHFLVSFILVGVMLAPQLRSLVNALGMTLSNVFLCFNELFSPNEKKEKVYQSKNKYRFKRLRFYIIPVAIILLFAWLYGIANPEFGKYVNSALGWLYDSIAAVLESIDFWVIPTLIFGFLISVYVLKRGLNPKVVEIDEAANDSKIRRKNHFPSAKTMALKNEYRAGVFLFASLNVLIFLMNIMDVDHVWLNFEWEGQYLRQFVHYGTIVLVIALGLSVILVLYFFRGNLNYYSKNKTLKTLCYIWLGQNAILAVSAGIRNFYYIQYYSLAYKRIAIIFFIVLTIYGLYSVLVKIKDTRSTFYVIRKNAIAWTVVLVISVAFNWDRIIAEYNFSRGKGSFVHLNFLANLSDTALPAMDQPLAKLKEIDQFQEKSFFPNLKSSSSNYRALYLSPKQYIMTVEWRKQLFKHRWEQKSWLEWNYAEAKAYQELEENNAF